MTIRTVENFFKKPIAELKRFPKFAKSRTDQPRWSGAWIKIGKDAKEWGKIINKLLSEF